MGLGGMAARHSARHWVPQLRTEPKTRFECRSGTSQESAILGHSSLFLVSWYPIYIYITMCIYIYMSKSEGRTYLTIIFGVWICKLSNSKCQLSLSGWPLQYMGSTSSSCWLYYHCWSTPNFLHADSKRQEYSIVTNSDSWNIWNPIKLFGHAYIPKNWTLHHCFGMGGSKKGIYFTDSWPLTTLQQIWA